VDYHDLRKSLIEQCSENGSGGTAGTQENGLPVLWRPRWRCVLEIGQEAFAVRACSPSDIILHKNSVHDTETFGGEVGNSHSGECRLLKRQCHVTADIAVLRQRQEKVLYILGLHGFATIFTIDAMEVQPI